MPSAAHTPPAGSAKRLAVAPPEAVNGPSALLQLLGEVLDENLEGPLHIDQRAVGPAALAAKLRAEIDNLRASRPRNGRGLLATRLRKWREWGRPAP